MNMQKKPKMAALLAMTIALSAVLAGCGGNQASGPAADNTPAANLEADPASANQEPAEANDSGDTQQPADEPAELQATGTFVGLADPHTVAILIDGTEKAFQIGDELTDAVSALETDDPVAIAYTERVVDEQDGTKQLILVSIALDEASGAGADPASSGAAELAPVKTFTVSLEGNEEQREAKLAQADGYALYVFDPFTFDAASNTLAMNVDKAYNVKIEKLADGTKLEDVRKDAETALGAVGEVREMKGEEIAEPLRDAKLFLAASDGTLQREEIVREIGGKLYRFSVNMPVGEASEGFGPHAFVSMASVVDQS